MKKLKLTQENVLDMIAIYRRIRDALDSTKKESAMAPGFHPEPRDADDNLALATPPVVNRKTT